MRNSKKEKIDPIKTNEEYIEAVKRNNKYKQEHIRLGKIIHELENRREFLDKDPFVHFPLDFSDDLKLDIIKEVGMDKFSDIAKDIYENKVSVMKYEYEFLIEKYKEGISRTFEYRHNNKIDGAYYSERDVLLIVLNEDVSDYDDSLEVKHTFYDGFRFANVNHLRNSLIKKGVKAEVLDLKVIKDILYSSDDWGKAFYNIIVLMNEHLPEADIKKFISDYKDNCELININYYKIYGKKKPRLSEEDIENLISKAEDNN